MSNTGVVRKIWALLLQPDRRRAVYLLALMVAGMVFEALGVSVIVPVVAVLTDPGLIAKYPLLQSWLSGVAGADRSVLVIGAMLGLVAIFVLKTVFLAYLTWRQTSFAFGLQAKLSERLFASYLRQPYTFHLQRNSAELIRNAVTEVNMFTFNGMIAGMTLLTETLVLLGLGALLLVIEPVGALIVVSVLGAATGLSVLLTRGSLLRWGKARQIHEGLRIQHLQQGLGGVKDAKLLGREEAFLQQYSLHNVQSALAGQFQLTLQQLPRLWLELLAVAGLAILVLTLVWRDREIAAILPTLGLFAAAAFRLMPSANRVLASLQSLRFGLPVIDILYRELALESSAEKPLPGAHLPFRDKIEICHVTYAYSGASTPALRDVTLSIRRGESVGVIGTSGAGKSTLVDVLLGLLQPQTGEVRVDGVDVRSALRGWQDRIGYVPQSIFLTDDTLRNNVTFGLPAEQIDEAAVWRALTAAQLHDFVRTLPDGLDTVVGERGVRLSGGQRQRIGIARAVYHDPEVLVLDEATSSLDTATESEVMQAVTSMRGTKTIIIVAHRMSTVYHCNRLYRLEHGCVTQAGTPATMLASA